MVEVKGLRNINWQLQNGDVKYSIGNIVSNSVIAVWWHVDTVNSGGALCIWLSSYCTAHLRL